MTFWYRLCWWICRIGLFFWHPVLHVHGRELVPAGCALLCANHSGMADPIWIMLALNSPKMIRILAKEELRRVPFLGWVMEKFDIIFLDPPYAAGLLEPAIAHIARFDILAPHGIIVAEHPAGTVLPALSAPYRLHRTYRYGKIGLTVYRRSGNEKNEEQAP